MSFFPTGHGTVGNVILGCLALVQGCLMAHVYYTSREWNAQEEA